MLKKQLIYAVLVLAFFLIGIVLFEQPYSKPSMGKAVFPELGLSFQVEIAETEKQRAQGLMLRPFLALDKGMLFIFAQDGVHRVWMKNTLIELDVIFISEKGVIVSILQGLKPCSQEPCEVYSSNKNAKYMLEVNAGAIEKTGVTVGQKFILDRL